MLHKDFGKGQFKAIQHGMNTLSAFSHIYGENQGKKAELNN